MVKSYFRSHQRASGFIGNLAHAFLLLCSTEWFGDVGLETQWWMDKERKWRAGAWRGPVPPPGLPAQLAQLIPAFCWWGKSATPHCTVQSRESSLLVSEWVTHCAHYASAHVSHADFAFVYPSVCMSAYVWAVSSPLDWSPTVLSISKHLNQLPITGYTRKKKNPKATYSNVINSYEKKLWEVCLDTLIEIKKKKNEMEGAQDQKISSYGLRSQRLEKVIFQHFSANNSRLRNKLHVLMLNSPSPPTREIK